MGAVAAGIPATPGGPAPPSPAARRARSRSASTRHRAAGREEKWLPYVLTLPILATAAVLIFVPLGLGIWVSFTDADTLSPDALTGEFTVENYTKLVSDGAFWNSVRVTVVYSVGSVLGSLVLGLLTAVVLNRAFRYRGLVRTLILLPWAVPNVVAVLVWVWMYNPQHGVLNYLLTRLPLVDTAPSWLSSPSYSMLAVIIVTVWKSYPFSTLMFLAGLQGIRHDLYEAAAIDGANGWRQFRDITLPGLRSVASVVVVLVTIWSFGEFTFIFLMTEGGPAGATETLVLNMYQRAFRFFDASYAFAVGMVLLLLAVAITAVYARITRVRW
ncbi:carbohydrate ABC transporter permease [Phytoactinopolyspora limicola]|uniref:carbohydrate ABC transporter permease n=1 Tax=Phytoactinopolyspora limicola TaxID=2715536 RepID=UPI00140C9DF9|nr:sugar ABC transporter permease [Phytoactinopolyspora limicola]